mmetsp:Transcript_47613/g.113364  ORF Transcript_47613/g.113364 Transcript_47613/m.113364 type:complete len:298 (-) Transcript_47613:393-1286(-)
MSEVTQYSHFRLRVRLDEANAARVALVDHVHVPGGLVGEHVEVVLDVLEGHHRLFHSDGCHGESLLLDNGHVHGRHFFLLLFPPQRLCNREFEVLDFGRVKVGSLGLLLVVRVDHPLLVLAKLALHGVFNLVDRSVHVAGGLRDPHDIALDRENHLSLRELLGVGVVVGLEGAFAVRHAPPHLGERVAHLLGHVGLDVGRQLEVDPGDGDEHASGRHRVSGVGREGSLQTGESGRRGEAREGRSLEEAQRRSACAEREGRANWREQRQRRGEARGGRSLEEAHHRSACADRQASPHR